MDSLNQALIGALALLLLGIAGEMEYQDQKQAVATFAAVEVASNE